VLGGNARKEALMIIATMNDRQPYWKYHGLFDTQTGIRYTLFYKRENGIAPEVFVDIESANASHGEYGSGIRYSAHEAVDFWLALKNLAPDDKMIAEQIHQSAQEASERLLSLPDTT
jgi:hypothetical protein